MGFCMTNQIVEPMWTDWIFGLTIPASGWLTLWGGIFGAFAAVLIAIAYERYREKQREKAAISRLRDVLVELEASLSRYRDQQIPHDVESIIRPELIEVWRQIVAADSVVQWAMNTPSLHAFEHWNEIAHLGASFDNETDAIAANRVSIPEKGKVSRPDHTPSIARHLLPQLCRTIEVLR